MAHNTIGIDISRADVANPTGVEKYVACLIRELKTLIPSDVRVVLYTRHPSLPDLGALPATWEIRYLAWPPKRLWTQLRLSWEMLRRPPDLLFVPAHAFPLVLPRKRVITVHDIAFFHTPEAYGMLERLYQKFVVSFAVGKADRVLTVSEFSKSELAGHFAKAAQKTLVTHLGYEPEDFGPKSPDECQHVLSKYHVSSPYFLFVGRVEAKKNVLGILQGFKYFLEQEPLSPHTLVLAGKPGHGHAEIATALDKLRLGSRVRETGYVDREDLPYLYSAAEAFVFPSLYEGFGIPLLEAFACGTPVVASRAGSLPEVGGNAAYFVDADKPEQIGEAMRRLMSEDTLRRDLMKAGFERMKQFSWRKTAEETWTAMQAVLDGK